MGRTALHLSVFAAAGLALAACGDRSPTAARDRTPRTLGGSIVTAYDCTVTVATLQASCVLARPGGGARADLIVGTPYVTLASRNAAYDSTFFTFEVAVTNHIPQPIGTTDGTTVASSGIRVFFNSGPTVTSGTGTAAVVPDGFGTFTAPGQPYYRYGEVLDESEQSAWKLWTLVIPPTVHTFSWTLYISAPVQYPNGWVTVSPVDSYLFVNNLQVLTATAYNQVGTELTSATFDWASDDTDVATVSSSGLVYTVGAGLATVTVTDNSGLRTGTARIHVE